MFHSMPQVAVAVQPVREQMISLIGSGVAVEPGIKIKFYRLVCGPVNRLSSMRPVTQAHATKYR